MDDIRRAPGAHEALPLFPLPEYALFPHTLAPFHVFEPRYVAMLDHCLADRRLLVVAGLEPGWEEAYHGVPPVYPVGGLARVVSDRRLRHGRSNIFVHCVARVRIAREVQREPFRLVDVDAFPDRPPSESGELRRARDRIIALVASLTRELGAAEGAALARILAAGDDASVLSHRLAGLVVEDPVERQRLLECPCPIRRCRLLADHVMRILVDGARRPAGDEVGWIN